MVELYIMFGVNLKNSFSSFLVMDHCYNKPCQNNGTCHSHLENYTCSCLKEFTGQNCEGTFKVHLRIIAFLPLSYLYNGFLVVMSACNSV